MTDPDSLKPSGGSDRAAAEERAELNAWLRQQGFDQAWIDRSISPLLLPANRVFGDDGDLVFAQEVADASGLPVDLIMQLHHWTSSPTSWTSSSTRPRRWFGNPSDS